mgnify:CR=1 FL=1
MVPTALVTGASGFIGSRLAQRLVKEGWGVKVLVRNPSRLPETLRGVCDVFVGDLLDGKVIRECVCNVNVIFHCAANVATWDKWESYRNANVFGVAALLQAIDDSKPPISRLVHFSTVDVYGYPNAPCVESSPLDGGGFGYGESKLEGERLLVAHCKLSGIPFTVLRPCNVIGPGSQFIRRLGDVLRSGAMIEIDGGYANAGLLYVDNLVDYALWAATSEEASGQCYNVRDDHDISWNIFIRQLREEIGGRGVLIQLPFPVADRLASGIEVMYRALMPEREPLLHRLLVRIFGRTCGHSREKLSADSGMADRFDYEDAMRLSVDWYLHQ